MVLQGLRCRRAFVTCVDNQLLHTSSWAADWHARLLVRGLREGCSNAHRSEPCHAVRVHGMVSWAISVCAPGGIPFVIVSFGCSLLGGRLGTVEPPETSQTVAVYWSSERSHLVVVVVALDTDLAPCGECWSLVS